MRHAVAILLFACVALAAAGPAAAQKKPTASEKKQARAHFERGKELQGAGQYDGAITEYKAAYALVPDPAFVFNVARSLHLKGDREAALAKYREYLALRSEGDIAAEARDFAKEIETALAAEAAERERVVAEEAARQRQIEEAELARREAEERAAREAEARQQAEADRRRLLGDGARDQDRAAPTQPRSLGRRLLWVGAGVALLGAGVVFDTLPDGASNGTLEAADFVPLPLYVGGLVGVGVGVF